MFKDCYFKLGNRTIYMNQLPSPTVYYQQKFPHLRETSNRWISVRCCFHEDRQPSLRLNLKNGSFRCFGCGVHGGSILSFHCQLYQMTLVQTLITLGGLA